MRISFLLSFLFVLLIPFLFAWFYLIFYFCCFQLGIVPNDSTPNFSKIGKTTEIIYKQFHGNNLNIYYGLVGVFVLKT